MRKIALAGQGLLLLVCVSAANAQTKLTDPNANGWYNYFGDHPLAKSRWGVHLEGQWRRAEVGLTWQQLLLRPGVNYQVNKSLMLTAGYGFIRTHRYGDYPVAARFDEHRFFEQAQYTRKVKKLDFLNRFRLEQRELQQPGNTARPWRHENRFRYMLRTTVPFGKSKYYLALYDEIMANFGKNVLGNHFDQNRAYAALGRDMGHQTKLEVGYMQQTLHRRGGVIWEYNHTLMVSVYSKIGFGRRN